ncbi:hypothetical protein I7I51_01013 [Histoplasma capsulatum]|uniref:Uncharacterized protein n=1 Tax=Ajellomyces capsulatus TaxID=5037 RepID=A0A8A1MHA5_AJECA|nr:predicted protein [Histoplasma mississippiense (nom. inval.)]EDN10905.1 predicted protein [Histoplasma mississippiense (nom. inval.)]QSS63952.1 hypothetical protein I7I51_01013 [Histoplasma capsulatum]
MYADRSQEFPSVSAVCVRYLRPDTEALRLGNAFMPSSISERIGKEIGITKQKILSLLETARHKLRSNGCTYELWESDSTDGWLYNVGSREKIKAYRCGCCCPLFRAEYYCDDYLALMHQSWYDKSVADMIECFKRRASDLKKLHKCAAGVYCPLVQVVYWLVNESYVTQKSHHGLSLDSFED